MVDKDFDSVIEGLSFISFSDITLTGISSELDSLDNLTKIVI